jgi:hypothetical protein
MHKITLVCSVHRERGLCNSENLLKILRTIEPDAIFVEWRPSEEEFYYNVGNVEARAIARYREYKSFQSVPVDRYDIPQNLLAEMRDFEAWVIQKSPEYQVLMDRENDSVHLEGFKYLNSAAFARMSARMSEIEEETVNRTADQHLIHWLGRLRHLMQGRESEMVGKIYEYCSENVFDIGVFLIGASHKTAIVKETERFAGTKAVQIAWNLDFDA